MTKRIISLLLAVAWFSETMAASVEFGWHPGTHGTADDWSTDVIANVGWLNKGLVFFAKPGDVLDSIKFYGTSGDGDAEECRVYLYTLTGDLGKPGDLELVDTITGITIAAGTFGCDVNYAFTARTWHCLAGDSLSPSAGGFYGPHSTTAGTAAVMVPQIGGEDVETKTAPGDDPWGAEGTNSVSFREMWGVVTLGTVSSGRNKVTYVSDWDTTSGTGTNDTMICQWPTSMQAGDVIVAMIMKGDDLAGSTLTEKAGWSVLHEASSTAGDDQMLGVYYKIYNGSNLGSDSIFVFSAAETFSGGLVAFRNVDTTAITDCSPFTNYILGGGSIITIKNSITTQTDSSMVVMFATASLTDTGTVTTPTGTTNLWARKAGNNTTTFNASFAAYDLKETAGATGDYTWGVNDVTATDAHGFIVALRPKAPATGATTITVSED